MAAKQDQTAPERAARAHNPWQLGSMLVTCCVVIAVILKSF